MIMDHRHAVVWVDHHEAHLVKFGLTGADSTVLKSGSEPEHLHHKANSIGDGRAPKNIAFYEKLAAALNGASTILITGPGSAKLELVNYIRSKHPSLAAAIVGVEPLDHPTEGELLKFARSYFKAEDRMRP
jgi:stalled ribosome rescue protein Dom34